MPSKIIFTKEQTEDIIKFYEKDLKNTKEIGNVFGCSEPTILKILKDLNINTTRNERRKLLILNGKIKIWNKGLTKKDSRVLRNISGGSRRTQFKKGRESEIKGKKWKNFYGDKRAEQIRIKVSKTKIEGYASGKVVPHNKGKTKDNYKPLEVAGRHISEILIGREGRPHTEETKRKMSESKKGIPKPKELCKRWSKTRKRLIEENSDKIFFFKNGKQHPQWLGGKSFEPYTKEFNNIFKKSIKLRDNFICLKCNQTEEQEKQSFNKGLSIHHINYNKKHTSQGNCCVLCGRCNAIANFNRPYWQSFFQNLLVKKYGYLSYRKEIN